MDARKKLSHDFSPGNSSLFDTVRGLSYFKPFDFWLSGGFGAFGIDGHTCALCKDIGSSSGGAMQLWQGLLSS